jgi:hypothetical protein
VQAYYYLFFFLEVVEKKSVDPVIKAKSEVLTTIGDLEQVNIFF